jgi:MFS family permease
MPRTADQPFHAASSPAAVEPAKRLEHPNLILAICCMSVLIFSMDATIVNVALPAIQKDLHARVAGLQWILDAYTLVVASFLMLSGSMSDRFGRRKVFQIGLAVFTLASLLCSQARTIEQLIAHRALQGVGASMMNPVALLAAFLVPESKAERPRRFDPVGQMLVLAGLTTLTWGVIEGPHVGWSSGLIVGLFVAAALALLAFVLYEPRRKDPLLDLRFFGSVPFSSATVLALSSYSCFGGFLFLNTLYLQQVRGFSAFQTGLFTLPLAVAMVVCAPWSGRLVGSHGPRPSLLAAGVGFLISTVILTGLNQQTSAGWLLAAYALFGVGVGMVNPAISDSAVAGMPLSQAGVAAAIASTSRQVGVALGVAVSGTVVKASHAHGTDFTRATHATWWLMTACGALVLALGFAANTAWARASTERVAYLLEERR